MCYEQHAQRVEDAKKGHSSGEQNFAANIKPRLNTAPPGAGASKFLPGYGGFVPGQRFKFETSEGTLAKTWAPRRPIETAGGGTVSGPYKAAQPRPKMRS